MRPAETRRFIKRRWSHVLCSLDTMKSDKGKIERVKIFFKSLDMQFGKLDPATEALVVQLKREAADMLNCFEIFITIKCKD
jgi:DNA/RNA-binding domain of Phe-tRNA-synthetase-like protein